MCEIRDMFRSSQDAQRAAKEIPHAALRRCRQRPKWFVRGALFLISSLTAVKIASVL